MSYLIREIKTDQKDLYKQFFSIGLNKDEENFRTSVNDDRNAAFPTQDKPDSFTLGAYLNDKLVGVVSFARDGIDREKLRHKGVLVRMYVSEEHRVRGVGKNLINNLIARVKEIGNIEQINLTVVSHNQSAILLYESFGFKIFSTEMNAIKWKGKYFTENQMVLML